jgi:hypothetical protein
MLPNTSPDKTAQPRHSDYKAFLGTKVFSRGCRCTEVSKQRSFQTKGVLYVANPNDQNNQGGQQGGGQQGGQGGQQGGGGMNKPGQQNQQPGQGGQQGGQRQDDQKQGQR